MSKIIGWVLDLLFGPEGEDYVSRTTAEQSRLETLSLEALQNEINAARAERMKHAIVLLEPELPPLGEITELSRGRPEMFAWMDDEREPLCPCKEGPESGCFCNLDERAVCEERDGR